MNEEQPIVNEERPIINKECTAAPVARKLTPEYKLSRRVREAMMKGIRRYNLVRAGDHILIGLSGGKDSLALLELLGTAAQRSGGRFRVSALHVRMANIDYETDTTYLQNQCAAVGVPLLVRETSFQPDRNARRTPCFLCSWTRRKVLFAVAQELGCNKIALGHHQDDILRTALMNLTFAGSFSTMPARLALQKMPLTIIRPLCLVHEDDLRRYAALRGFQPLKKVCPHDASSNRTAILSVAEAMTRLNPEARYSLWHALDKAGCLVQTGDGLS